MSAILDQFKLVCTAEINEKNHTSSFPILISLLSKSTESSPSKTEIAKGLSSGISIDASSRDSSVVGRLHLADAFASWVGGIDDKTPHTH